MSKTQLDRDLFCVCVCVRGETCVVYTLLELLDQAASCQLLRVWINCCMKGNKIPHKIYLFSLDLISLDMAFHSNVVLWIKIPKSIYLIKLCSVPFDNFFILQKCILIHYLKDFLWPRGQCTASAEKPCTCRWNASKLRTYLPEFSNMCGKHSWRNRIEKTLWMHTTQPELWKMLWVAQ